ncbi:hypothetical protein EVAR_21092_1 [Eumeta japonica]|uniref:Uncharacterized protein n=1 Tax=Eumeta variegata TaxID=151549 RepID=A0A4C1UZZ8_EUMVA|nr:hypothetical protein EVAR_21092_1 [Eumeta japonica]
MRASRNSIFGRVRAQTTIGQLVGRNSVSFSSAIISRLSLQNSRNPAQTRERGGRGASAGGRRVVTRTLRVRGALRRPHRRARRHRCDRLLHSTRLSVHAS